MTEADDPHPAGGLLAGFALGTLDDDHIAAVTRHLSVCAACRETAAGASDGFLDLLRPDPAPAAEAPDLPAGLRDHCRYRVLRRLGRGGMGAVYLAEHRMMKQLRAVKVIDPALVGNPRVLERFVREIELLSRLNHPAVVQAFDAETADGSCLLVMEYVEGESLAQLVAREGPLPVAAACDYARQAALGLHHAHGQGLVHRDVKPANLMRTAGGRVKILDFGLARLAGESRAETGLTQEHAAMGTPDYTAPEQALDARHADARADVYSLGCTLFYLLTGRPPFPEANAVAVSVAHVQAPPPSLRVLRPDAPAGLCDLVGRMLAKPPDRRPQTAAEVADALAPFAEHQPEARAKSRTTLRSRFRLIWAGAAALLLVVGILIGWSAAGLRVHTSNGTIVLEQLPDDAEVLVDGDTVALTVGAGKPAEITIASGRKHQLQVKKDGFKVFGKELEIDAGERRPVVVRLEGAADGPAREENAAFVPLFNGKDLTGWTTFDGGVGGWKVEDGAIVGRGHVPFLYSERGDFENFHLRLEAMINEGGETGFYFRSPFVSHPPAAYNAKINANADNPQRTGSLNDISPFVKKATAPDEWFTLEVIVRGEHIVLKVNGAVTADATDRRFIKGHFVLQESGVPTVVRYRKIEVKRFPAKDDP